MEERKKCIVCKKNLLVFQGQHLHPDTPCNGLKDYIDIEATITNEFLHDKFKDLYGEPKLNDYDRLNLLEKNIFIRIVLYFMYKFNKKKD